MRNILILILLSVALTGCAASYQHDELRPLSSQLDSEKGVLIAIPENGRYETTVYRHSGKMTANAVIKAFRRHVSKLSAINTCWGKRCSELMSSPQFGYYVVPDILHWEERATEWSCIPDRIEIELAVYDITSKAELARSTFTGKSKITTFGGDHPQDLLDKPTRTYVDSLY